MMFCLLFFSSVVCSGVPIGVPATPIPDDGDVFAGLGIQAPSAEQELCLAAQFEARATEASVACSDLLSEDTPVDEEPVRGLIVL